MTASDKITTLAKVNADTLAKRQEEAETELAEILAVTQIDTVEECEVITSIMNAAAREADALVKERQSAVGPIKQGITKIEGWFRPAVRAREAIRDHCKALVNAYLTAKRAEEREAQARLMAAAAAAEPTEAPIADVLSASAAVDVGAAKYARDEWIWRVDDLDQVPRRYMCLDTSAMKLYLKACASEGWTPEIPGMTFTLQTKTQARK